ncbi:class I SAM-dependent methyltransferase [Spongisporangium articulatum]|uniref:Class I SAM-dependent methyltransferase n=1 Tax=Spongisporangium articulatum TaxID=3362603 RepID=A0ABW8AJY7_9ACTN
MTKFDELQEDWTRLGADDPLWAVYVAPGTKGGKWDVEKFFALGRAEVDGALAQLPSLGLAPNLGAALDFGCGVGRLSQALAAHVDRVTGVDISPPMLAKAREFAADRGFADRIEFVLNEATDLAVVPDASIDVVYSSLVLQHMPPELQRGYLREFTRVLAPGGVAIFQVASRPTASLKGFVFRHAPWPLLRWAQKTLLGYPAPMRMSALPPDVVREAIEGTGARLAGSVEDETYGGHWHYTRYYVTR